MNDVLERRMLNAEYGSELEIFAAEMSKAEGCVLKFDTQAREIIEAIQKLRVKSKRVLLSQQQVKKKLMHVQQLNGRKNGVFVPPVLITVADRHNWLLRYSSAVKGAEDTEEEKESKYEEIRCVCSEFLSIATADALIILSETFLPPFSKTIPIGAEYPVHGRSIASGRGHDGARSGDAPGGVGKDLQGGSGDGRRASIGGTEVAPTEDGPKHYTYELHNIVYTVIEDHNGIFNGSDDFAMKAAGNDRKAGETILSLPCEVTASVHLRGASISDLLPLKILTYRSALIFHIYLVTVNLYLLRSCNRHVFEALSLN